MSALPVPTMTYAEYLELERRSEVKHEFVDGHVYAMSGGTPEHARLAGELAYLFRRALEGRPCRVCSSDLRVRIDSTKNARYPDLTIVCGAPETSKADGDAVVNPTVLVEVSSKSSEKADHVDKWAHYRRLASLKAYVIGSQDEPRIETYRRDGTRWIYEEAGPGESLVIGGVDVPISIDELYRGALMPPAMDA